MVKKKLVSRAVRNYLDKDEQEVLFEKLTGEKVEIAGMLGRVEKVNPAISQAYIKSLSEKLYENTPTGRKIIPPQESIEGIKSEEEMDCALSRIDVWLVAVYEMMESGVDPEIVLQKFRGWENAVKDYIAGKDVFEKFQNLTIQDMRAAVYDANSFLSEYVDREYEAGMNGCGLGSGLNMLKKTVGPMTYESMSGDYDSNNCPEIKCRKCAWKANENEVREITKGKLSRCPKCGWKP